MSSHLRPFAVAAILLAGLATAHAQTTLHLFRGGENDAGAVNGGALAATTIDAGTGATNLTLSGAGTYTNSTPDPGSALALVFNGTNTLYTGSVDTSLTTTSSFVMETWFNADSLTGDPILFYNGNSGISGIGLLLNAGTGKLASLAGGVAIMDGATAVNTGTWNHAALVWDNGNLRLFLNGVQDLNTAATFNAPPTDALTLGGVASGNKFDGALDHARIFTFATGTFNTSMLTYPAAAIPEPSTYAALAGLGALGLAFWRRRTDSRRS